MVRDRMHSWSEHGQGTSQLTVYRDAEFDKAKGASRTGMSGSIFGSSTTPAAPALPQELAPLVAPQKNVTRLFISTQGSVSTADAEFDKIINGQPPAAPVYAARLNGLLKTIVDGEDAMRQMVKARMDLKDVLDNLRTQYDKLLEVDQQRLRQLEQRRQLVDERKRQVEDKILRDLSGAGSSAAGHSPVTIPIQEPPRPEMEALTPPTNDPGTPDEPVFPGGEPELPQGLEASTAGETSSSGGHGAAVEAPQPPPSQPLSPDTAASKIDILSHLASQAVPVSTNGANKRRRVDSPDEVPDLDDGIDADVAETLRKDSLGV